MSYDLGDTVYLSTTVTDASLSLVAATGVVCSVGLPDGTTATPAVTTVSTGRYTASFVPTQAGRHTERWSSTSPAFARSDTFDVRAPTPPYLVSLVDLKAHLNMDLSDSSNDEELRGFIEAATLVVERHRREAVVRRTVVETLWVNNLGLHPSVQPVQSITSAVSTLSTATWNPAELRLYPTGVLQAMPYTLRLWGEVTLTYVAGYAVVPANFTLAALIIAAHLWSSQRSGTLIPSQMGARFDDSSLSPSVSGYAIPNRALELLGGQPPLVA